MLIDSGCRGSALSTQGKTVCWLDWQVVEPEEGEMVILVENLVKRYDDVVAVDQLTFEVGRGELFGLLGPNGAGKTTTIRVMMDILQPDAGSVRILGQRPADAKERVGYLPEERGLYRDIKVLDTLVYLAELKGMSRTVARDRGQWLRERVRLDDWADRKVRDLSRGMQQRLQFIASLVHDPDLLILDEPFQGLDPVNTERLKGFVDELREDGKTIVLSTHQMNLVEALCDRILLVDRGRAVLYGRLDEIKEQNAANTIRLRADEMPGELPGVLFVEPCDGAFNLTLAEHVDPQDVLRNLVEREIRVREFEVAPVPLEDIFVAVVGGEED
jgi:ABC-2 type transport system ATP-binding protein